MPVNSLNNGYSAITGSVYIFNLVVGTGALALPGVVSKAGFIAGSILILLLGFFSYITVTFIIEAQSLANAINNGSNSTQEVSPTDNNEDEDYPLLETNSFNFEMVNKFEFSQLATNLLSTSGKMFVSFCLILYLLGDLAIYCAVVAKTMSHTLCDTNATSSFCWEEVSISRLDFYRICVAIFVCLLGPFVFFQVQKTKFLQILTSLMRWMAFLIMISWSIILIYRNNAKKKEVLFDINAFPILFGTCVYSFMCQHSIPSLVHPITNKSKFIKILPIDYSIIAVFYTFMSISAVFAFDDIEDVYTLNFWSEKSSSLPITILQYFLALFPIFTLSTSFPIIAITLKNNLTDILVSNENGIVKRVVIPLCTILVPMFLALFVPNVQTLVGFVGSYAGSGLQYLVPCLVLSAARKKFPMFNNNPYKSPFESVNWIRLVYAWTAISLITITINHVI